MNATIKVGDIFVLSRRPLKVAKVMEIKENICLLSVSSQQYGPLRPAWYSNNSLKGRKKAIKKDWYRAIRQYNENGVTIKNGDIYYIDKERSTIKTSCSFVMRIKRIEFDNKAISFDRIVFPKSGKIYYDVKHLSTFINSIDQWRAKKISRKSWYILIRKLNND